MFGFMKVKKKHQFKVHGRVNDRSVESSPSEMRKSGSDLRIRQIKTKAVVAVARNNLLRSSVDYNIPKLNGNKRFTEK